MRQDRAEGPNKLLVTAVANETSRYNPIQELAPQDCVSRINFIVDSFDHLVATNNTAAVNKFKSLFGLESVKDNRDFAMTISFPIGNPMNYPTETWQELNWDPNQGYRDFFYFCGNVTDDTLPKNVTDVDYALAEYTNGKPWTGLGAYAKYVQEILLPMCPDADYDSTTTGCFGTQNRTSPEPSLPIPFPLTPTPETYWADPTSSASRSYLYSTCTEQGAYQVAPAHGPSLISRVLQVDYTQQWCIWAFPPGRYNSIPAYVPPCPPRPSDANSPQHAQPDLLQPLRRLPHLRAAARPHRRQRRRLARRRLPRARRGAAHGAAAVPDQRRRAPLGQLRHPRRAGRAAVHPRGAPVGAAHRAALAGRVPALEARQGGARRAVRRRARGRQRIAAVLRTTVGEVFLIEPCRRRPGDNAEGNVPVPCAPQPCISLTRPVKSVSPEVRRRRDNNFGGPEAAQG